MAWKLALVYYLTYLDRYRARPMVERLSYLSQDPTYQDVEYQTLLRAMACET